MERRLYSRWNPNPISKILATLALGLTMIRQNAPVSLLLSVGIFVLAFGLLGRWRTSLRILVFFLLVLFLTSFTELERVPFALKWLFSILIMMKFFFLPIIAGKFFVETSDPGTVMASLEALHMPSKLTIPFAVMYRFFPAFAKEREHIKTAMKLRGVTPKNPLKYLEYVAVPLLISSAQVADDIAMAAETRCIADPCPKVRYQAASLGVADVVFLGSLAAVLLGGMMYGSL
ncbi:Transmembrane component of energizing module of predicted ECF transporter [Clostridiaceae bacterium JG1575]|nr:Transmembrane component of energizing module of predicted ECF transporter [Clostridiaceae bacterium JG1575]